MKKILGLLIFSSICWANQPDCVSSYLYTTRALTVDNAQTFRPGAFGPNFNNQAIACSTWAIIYYSEGFDSQTLQVLSASTSSNPAIPGTYVPFNGTITGGFNPSTTVNGLITFSGYNPWVTTQLTAAGQGTMRVFIYGWTSPGFSGSGSGGGTTQITVNNIQPVNGNITLPNVNTSLPLFGGGALTSNLTLGVNAATSSTLGVVQPDNTSITINNGVISANGNYVPLTRNIFTTLPLTGGGPLSSDLTLAVNNATSTTFGVVKPDNTTITVSGGVLSAVNSGNVTALNGTTNFLAKFTGPNQIGNSSVFDNGTITELNENTSLIRSALAEQYTNSGGPGTGLNELVKINASAEALTIGTADTTNVYGICIYGCGTTGNSQIAYSGQAQCIFDGTTVVGHFVIASTTTGGYCHDGGATETTGVQNIGRILSVNTGAGTLASIDLFTPDTVNAGKGNGVSTFSASSTIPWLSTTVTNASTTPALTIGYASTPSLVGGTGISVSGTWPSQTISAINIPHALGVMFDGQGSVLTAGKTTYYIYPYTTGCTIQNWNMTTDTGTATIKIWKISSGTTIPTSSNSISTSGFSVSSGTAVHSTVLTDLTTTTVNAYDIFGFNLSAVSTATEVSLTMACQ